MKNIKYLLQFFFIMFFFGIFKIIGLKNSKYLSGNLMTLLGPIFRSKKIIFSNLSKAFPNLNDIEKKKILKKMWFNYGRIFAEYMFIKDFRNNSKEFNKIIVENPEILEKIKIDSRPVIFISGHFSAITAIVGPPT